jgi:hypothetical protein
MGHNAVAVLLTAGELAGIGLVISPAIGAVLFKEYLPLQLPPEEVRNGRKMTIIAEPGADEAKGSLFGE